MNTLFVLNLVEVVTCYSDVEVDSGCGQPTVMLGVVRLETFNRNRSVKQGLVLNYS